MQGVPHLPGLPTAVHGCAYCGKDATALPGIGWLPAVTGCNVCRLDRGGLAGKQKPTDGGAECALRRRHRCDDLSGINHRVCSHV